MTDIGEHFMICVLLLVHCHLVACQKAIRSGLLHWCMVRRIADVLGLAGRSVRTILDTVPRWRYTEAIRQGCQVQHTQHQL